MTIEAPSVMFALLTRPWSGSVFSGMLHRAGILTKSVLPPDLRIESVAIDSRVVRPGSLFVALKGARADGHQFLGDVAERGASAALISESFVRANPGSIEAIAERFSITFVVVVDPLFVLQECARLHLADLNHLIKIGITGSNGKTTTKDLLASVISRRSRCAASPGNLNSVIGLPLAALIVSPDTEIAVFEMAMSERGEMRRLSEIVVPDVAIVTNVGTAHIGNIGTQLDIAYEKKQISSQFTGGQSIFLPAADQYSDVFAEGIAGTVNLYGERQTPGYEGWEPWEEGQIVMFRGERIRLRLPGAHNRSNVLAVIQVAVFLGFDVKDIKAGLEQFTPAFGRSEILRGELTIVQDCYNANPDSMRASILSFFEVTHNGGRRILVLGDMKELGGSSKAMHAAIGRLAIISPADIIFFYGSEMHAAYHAALQQFPRTERFESQKDKRLLFYSSTFEELAAKLLALVHRGDAILLKASRGMELERITPLLRALSLPDIRSRDV